MTRWRRRARGEQAPERAWDVHYDPESGVADGSGQGLDDTGWDREFGWHTGQAGPGAWLPAQVHIAPRAVCVDGRWAATLTVLGLPREVYPGWLEPLAGYPAPLALALHIDTVEPALAARQLRRQLARLESVRHADATGSRLIDPHTSAAAADAHELSQRLARAETRLHRMGLAITVHAEDPRELGEHVTALRTLASSLLIDARPTTYQALAGWTTTLPIGIDSLGHRRALDTEAAASSFPFASPDLPSPDPLSAAHPSGILLGHNIATNALVVHDRFAEGNYNQVVMATSGAGKSYAVKLATLRGLYAGIDAVIIDPEQEYAALAETVGGAHIRLGAPGVRVNPFDLPGHTPTHPDPTHPDAGPSDAGPSDAGPSDDDRCDSSEPGPEVSGFGADADLLTRRALFVHSVLGVLLGALSPAEAAVADVGIHTAYRHAGITADPRTWSRPAPLLADLADALAATGDPLGAQMATRLAPYVSGSFSRLFAGPTTTAPTAHLCVYSLKALPEQLVAVGVLMALDACWRTIANPALRRPRVVVVDEAWLLLAHPAGAQFLLRLAKASRKHWCGLSLITQDAGDVLSTDLGRAVVSNAATTLLLRTAPQAADRIADAYGLSEGERDFLISAHTGTGLLIAGSHRAALSLHASDAENAILTTDPRELATRDCHPGYAEPDTADPAAPYPADSYSAAPTPAEMYSAPAFEEGPDPL